MNNKSKIRPIKDTTSIFNDSMEDDSMEVNTTDKMVRIRICIHKGQIGSVFTNIPLQFVQVGQIDLTDTESFVQGGWNLISPDDFDDFSI